MVLVAGEVGPPYAPSCGCPGGADHVEVITLRRSRVPLAGGRSSGVIEIFAVTQSDTLVRRVGMIASASGGWGVVMAIGMLAIRRYKGSEVVQV